MGSIQGFFPNASKSNNSAIVSNDKRAFVDVGGCGFHAVALWFVDGFDHALIYPRVTTDTIRVLLDRHFTYFPAHQRAPGGALSPLSRLSQLVTDINKPLLVQSLAYTLARIAFDEMCANPLLYRDVFLGQHTETLLDVMHAQHSNPDCNGIAALSAALQLPMDLQILEPGREISAHVSYTSSDVNDVLGLRVILQQQSAHDFMPLVVARDWHVLLQAPSHPLAYTAFDSISSADTLLDIQTMIAKADDALLDRFDNAYTSLVSMVRAKELAKSDWMTIYIKGLADRNQFQQDPRCVGTELGNQHYFARIQRDRRGMSSIDFPQGDYENALIHSLVYAIARAMSLGEMNPDAVDAYMDTLQHARHER